MSSAEELGSKLTDIFTMTEETQRKWRSEDREYLSKHPEVRAVLCIFLQEVIKKKPNNVCEFASQLFSKEGIPKLNQMVTQHLGRLGGTLMQPESIDADLPPKKGSSISSGSKASK